MAGVESEIIYAQGVFRGIVTQTEDSRQRYLNTLKDVINTIIEKKPEISTVDSVSPSDSLTEDYGLDSFDLAELTVRLEDEYGVDVFEEEIVDEVSEILEKLE